MQIGFHKKKLAMTFAEIIIILGLIGVVSALSLPSLKKHSQQKEIAQQIKKAYMSLEDAIDNAILSKGSIRNWDFSDSNKFLENYIKPNYVVMNQTSEKFFITLDNQFVGVNKCASEDGEYRCWVCVDVNGSKMPNKSGIDRHFFVVQKNGEDIKLPILSVVGQLARNNWEFTDSLWEKPEILKTFYDNLCGNIFP